MSFFKIQMTAICFLARNPFTVYNKNSKQKNKIYVYEDRSPPVDIQIIYKNGLMNKLPCQI